MLKTGKLPAQYDPKQIHLTDIRTSSAPVSAPVGFDSTSTIGSITYNWGMLGNDSVGDCVIAGGEHETMILVHDGTGTVASFNDDTAIADYSTIAGYIPGHPETDRGTNMASAMSYRRHLGLRDATGARHKIGAYVALEPGNWNDLLEALFAFRVVGVGIEFPQSAMDQYFHHKPWTVVKGSPYEGGHYIPVVGHPDLNYVWLITWGRKIKMSRTFYMKNNDESYAFISPEMLKNNKSPAGYDMNQLNEILAAV